MKRTILKFMVSAGMLTLCQCGSPSPPKCATVPRASRLPADLLLHDARQAWVEMSRRPSAKARLRYNTATGKLFDQLRCKKGSWDDNSRAIGTQIDRSKTLGTGLKLEELEALVPASRIKIRDVGPRKVDHGIGIPLVGWKSAKTIDERRFQFAPPSGLPLNLTAVLDFSSEPPRWQFHYGGRVESVKIGKRREKMAVDWSAPAALYWQMSDLDDLDLAKVILPTRYVDHAGLFAATPYHAEKIPVVFLHGLNSSPGTYKRIYNHLMGQKWFRKNYQVWFFSYPTGTAWPYNAARFRREMRKARFYAEKRGPLTNWNKMVLIGHSMGGVIARASLIEPDTRLYDASYRRPLKELAVSRSTKKAIRAVRLYEPLEAPKRAIFMAAPHQGSPMADRFFADWIGRMIRLPKTLTLDFATATLSEITKAIQQGGQTRPPMTSIGTLSPGYRPYQALKASPFRKGLKYHSIIGDRGKGDGIRSSDGIVPYWSAHLPGAQSEKLVPCGHSVPMNQEAAEEVSRILKLHLR